MKKTGVYILFLVLAASMATAVSVGVVVDFEGRSTNVNDCVDVASGSNGKTAVDASQLMTTTWTEYPGIGFFLDSVNGVAGNNDNYWAFYILNSSGNGYSYSETVGLSGYTINSDGKIVAVSYSGFDSSYYPTGVPEFRNYSSLCSLGIKSVDVDVGSETDKDASNGGRISEEAKPGDTVKFEVELENKYTDSQDIEIDNANVKITIKDIDDSDDLDDESEDADIKADDKEKVEVGFKVPYEADEGDYKVIIEAEGDDDLGFTQRMTWILTLEVKKDKHELIFDRADITPNPVSCIRQSTLSTRLINIGEEDEDDATLKITSDALGINVNKVIEVDEGDDNTFEEDYQLNIADSTAAGTYPISLKVDYSSKSISKAASLVVEDCGSISAVQTTQPAAQEPVQEVIVEIPRQEAVATPAAPVKQKDDTGSIAVLALASAAALGGIVFMVWLLRK